MIKIEETMQENCPLSFKPFPEADSAEEEQRRIAELQLTRFSLENAGEAIFWIGEDSRLFYVNQTACRSLDYSRKELLSMTIHDVDPNMCNHRFTFRPKYRDFLRN